MPSEPSAAEGDFSAAPAGRTAQPCPYAKHYVTFEFKDALGNDAEGKCLLEHPDGRMEEVSHDGVLHRDDVPQGTYKVHFARLTKAAWSTEALVLPEEGDASASPPPKVELVVSHQAFTSGEHAAFAVRYASAPVGGAGEPLFEGKATLAHEAGTPLAERSTKLVWGLDGLPDVGPGEAVSLAFDVTAGNMRLTSEPLVVSRPASPAKAKEPDVEPTFVAFAFKDALGNPAKGPVILEHPDGHLEDVALEEGSLYREKVPGGTYKVHFPQVTGVAWAKDTLEATEEGALPSAEASLKHRCFPSGGEALYALRYESAPVSADPLASGTATLSTSGGKLAERETRVTIALRDALEVEPGSARALVLDVTAAGVRVTSPPLFVSRAAPEPVKIDVPSEE